MKMVNDLKYLFRNVELLFENWMVNAEMACMAQCVKL